MSLRMTLNTTSVTFITPCMLFCGMQPSVAVVLEKYMSLVVACLWIPPMKVSFIVAMVCISVFSSFILSSISWVSWGV